MSMPEKSELTESQQMVINGWWDENDPDGQVMSIAIIIVMLVKIMGTK